MHSPYKQLAAAFSSRVRGIHAAECCLSGIQIRI